MSSKDKWSTYRPSTTRKKRPRPDDTPDNQQDSLIIVDDVNSSIHDNVVEDSKVINYINRLKPKRSTTSSNDLSSVTLVVSVTEASYIDYNEQQLNKDLKKAFGISDIIISKETFNLVDKLVTVYGDTTAVSKAVVFISFVLSSKLNNPVKCESFTLKSSNYSLSILQPKTDLKATLSESGVKEFGLTHSSSMKNPATLISLKSDFNSLFSFFVQSSVPHDSSYLEEQDILMSGISLDQNAAKLYRNNEKGQVFIKMHTKEVLEYIYSEPFSA